MIGKLTGIVEKFTGYVILEVSGVGYIVFCSQKTYHTLIAGEKATLFIETHVREDHIHLFGFINGQEKEMFNLLSSVKGVGSRLALSVLSSLSCEEIASAVVSEDTQVFNNVGGVGKKLAQRLIVELKDKFTNQNIFALSHVENESTKTKNINMSDAVSALVNLGIAKNVAQTKVMQITKANPEATISDVIKLSLQK